MTALFGGGTSRHAPIPPPPPLRRSGRLLVPVVGAFRAPPPDGPRFLASREPGKGSQIRLGAGNLLLHSPISMTPGRRAAVDALGRVTHLYAPNLYHHLYIGEWAAAYPAALVHAPVDLASDVAEESQSQPQSLDGGTLAYRIV
jgi:hypothetical protein